MTLHLQCLLYTLYSCGVHVRVHHNHGTMNCSQYTATVNLQQDYFSVNTEAVSTCAERQRVLSRRSSPRKG